MKEEVKNYFESRFKEDIFDRAKLDGVPFQQISYEDSVILMAEFGVEVKQAIWDCESTKSLGPFGFNFHFIKEFWEMLKSDMMRFLKDFHRHGVLPRGTNSSFYNFDC